MNADPSVNLWDKANLIVVGDHLLYIPVLCLQVFY